MILILEVILTVVAWRRGWRGWALLPFAVVSILSLLIGVCGGFLDLTPKQEEMFPVVFLPLELAFIGVLAWMCSKGRVRPVRRITINDGLCLTLNDRADHVNQPRHCA